MGELAAAQARTEARLEELPAAAAASLPADRQDLIGRFQRADWYRFCLTPYFEEYE